MTYVMSDIHGYYFRYKEILKNINFSEYDELYIAGDVIDRGPDGIKILQDIMNRKNIHLIMGNHEHMMMAYLFKLPYYSSPYSDETTLELWFSNGGYPTYVCYNNLSSTEQEIINKFIVNLPYELNIIVNNENVRIVHGYPANIENFKNKEDVYKDNLIWARPLDGELFNVPDNQKVFIGHTPVFYYKKLDIAKIIELDKNIFDIDCGMAIGSDSSKLACIRIDDMKEFYV